MQSTSISVASITISGLFGFVNPDSSAQSPVPVTGTSISAVSGMFQEPEGLDHANWRRETGTLVFNLRESARISAGELYTFSVTLTNPSVPQSSPDLFVSTSGQVNVPPTRVSRPAGHYSPLYVALPTFLIANVSGSIS